MGQNKSVVVVGTNTDVGKSVVATWLAIQTGYAYFKPIETGVDGQNTGDNAKLAKYVRTRAPTFQLKAPLSPHRAALMEGRELDIEEISINLQQNLVIETAGGLLTPINTDKSMYDLVKMLDIPVVLVGVDRLGCLSDILLNVRFLQQNAVSILAIVLNKSPNPENSMKNLEDLRLFTSVPVYPLPELTDSAQLATISLPKALAEYFSS